MYSKMNTKNRILALLLSLSLLTGILMFYSPTAMATSSSVIDQYNNDEKPIVDALRTSFNGSLAQTLAGRAVWYMEYGFIVYGHARYATTGYADCSGFVSMVYKDFGYPITGVARKYDQVGVQVKGVYAQKDPGSQKYSLVGAEKLKPGDIFTFWAKDANGQKYISHVALYLGTVKGKPRIINTCKGNPTAIGIISDFSYWYGSNLYQVRRVLPDSAQNPGSKTNDQGPVIPAKYQMKPFKSVVLPNNLSPAGF